jgi:predicted dehydrogenase
MVKDPAIEILDDGTPDDRHRAPSIAAAREGKHIICERPLAMTVRDAAAMRDAVAEAGVKNLRCFNYRFFPVVRLAKELIDKGALGKIYHFRGRYLQEPGYRPDAALEDAWYASGTKSGILLGIGSHIIDMSRFLLGEIVGLSGLVRTYNTMRTSRAGQAETVTADEGSVTLVEFANGAIGTIESSGVATGHCNQHTWEINGASGSVAWDLEDPNHLQVFIDGAPLPEIRRFTNYRSPIPASPCRRATCRWATTPGGSTDTYMRCTIFWTV